MPIKRKPRMDTGGMDTLITLHREVTAVNASRDVVVTTVQFAKVWAAVKYLFTQKKDESDQEWARTFVTFTMRWSEKVAQLTTKDVVQFQGRLYEVLKVEPTPMSRPWLLSVKAEARLDT
jgi:SPP1 family predicted phage head-tail adaptor